MTNCETEVAGEAWYVCKNFKPAWVHPAVFPPAKLPVALCVSVCVCACLCASLCVCVRAHARGLLVGTNGSVPFLWDLSEWESVQCSALRLTESLRS